MKKILIAGKSSYVGTSFEEWMKQHSSEYKIDTIDLKDASWKEHDFSSYDSILHLAAIVHRNETEDSLYYKVNRDLAYETALKAKEAGVKQFIFFSTVSVYGLNEGLITATTPYIPQNAYGKSKYEAEKLLSELEDEQFRLVILRPPMVYGKNSPGNYLRLRKLALHWGLFPKVENSRSMIYIGNLCSFLQLVIEQQLTGLFHPQNTEFVNTNEMIRQIRKNHGKGTAFAFKWLGSLVVEKLSISVLKKVYGDLKIDKEISSFSLDYNAFSFSESIHLSENGKE
ncbi:NAD-dependent epimerase/dehydratase family protein [Enterococcus sp. BWM-S5]|uniref:NAD-dependent epimerase/dehydratase family protein n=1 Tax=Enterococcus larvae TaxID=2794352 RepID=A0ABS4CIG8_9ENTE|nr:NAD-dependent epimerase/dehydratase family protein [Enterococcus larvae]MBP1046356.1 NAD-dependent epimerase/dehydratase family protein [Enterococcus larvae]